jgi:predicted O-methyltransferase YrrM
MKLLRAIQPAVRLKLGVCLGISVAYQAAALALNGKGRLISIEGSASRAAKARETLQLAGLDHSEVVRGEFC